ncbi:hypothetical protein VTL71DRAFT_10583 [Oculimacula yallundae]|uniref:Uncharacterized protein n=1 Tax=Oculimacula yallundae TaxID=86028 RepID=A0ABR4CTN7_9HELO
MTGFSEMDWCIGLAMWIGVFGLKAPSAFWLYKRWDGTIWLIDREQRFGLDWLAVGVNGLPGRSRGELAYCMTMMTMMIL